MAEKPMWEQIGSGFVQHYYQQFDTDRVKLSELYTDASCLTWEGEGFQGKSAIMTKLSSLPFQTIQHIITAQDHHPTPDSCVMSMVMGQLKDIQNVHEFVSSLEQIWGNLALHHLLTNGSSAVNGSVLMNIQTHLHLEWPRADQDQVMGFQQVFLLKNIDNKWVCTNDMFRLALHNFGA